MQDEKHAATTGPTGGKSFSVVGDTYRILMSGEETKHAYAAIDMLVPPDCGPGPHSHAGIQEAFYLVDGEIEVKTETQTYIATKGSFVNIPGGGIVHCFKNKTDKVAHLLCIVVPSGLEEFFAEIGEPVAAGTFLPPPEMNAELAKKLVASAGKFGQKVYPPDYFDK